MPQNVALYMYHHQQCKYKNKGEDIPAVNTLPRDCCFCDHNAELFVFVFVVRSWNFYQLIPCISERTAAQCRGNCGVSRPSDSHVTPGNRVWNRTCRSFAACATFLPLRRDSHVRLLGHTPEHLTDPISRVHDAP